MGTFKDSLERERAIEAILLSNNQATVKVSQLRAVGLEEETAEEMVNNYQIGQMAPVYYERLDFQDTAEDVDLF